MQLPCFSSKCYTALPRPSSLLASCCSWHSLAARKESRVQACSYFMYNWNAWAEWARSSLERTGQKFCQDMALTKPSLIFTVFTTAFVVPQIGIIPFVNISSSTAAKDFLELQRPILITLPILPWESEKLQGSPNWAARRVFFSSLEQSWNSNLHLLPWFQSFKYLFPNYPCQCRITEEEFSSPC